MRYSVCFMYYPGTFYVDEVHAMHWLRVLRRYATTYKFTVALEYHVLRVHGAFDSLEIPIHRENACTIPGFREVTTNMEDYTVVVVTLLCVLAHMMEHVTVSHAEPASLLNRLVDDYLFTELYGQPRSRMMWDDVVERSALEESMVSRSSL